jgi:AAA domain, putative AbiEii toxin, Type IV TA system
MTNKKKTPSSTGLRLSRLSIKNYKKLDSLEIDFPRPLMENDLDILVFGSKNGGGKTSVIECSSLLLLAGLLGERFDRFRDVEPLLDVTNLLVTAGYKQAVLVGDFEKSKKTCRVTLKIQPKNFAKPEISGDDSIFKEYQSTRELWRLGGLEYGLSSILAFSGEPLIAPPLLHFNSYRKIQESNPELGMMADDYPIRAMRYSRSSMRGVSSPISFFKLEILRSLMGKASLFEGLDKGESESVLSQLNNLIERYCGGRIENLRPLPDNKVDIRIKLNNSENSFSFDGLSSGQKEMIATLFLIWKNTHDQPSIVLIDEPELHLNAEWHGDFVEQLRKLAPRNQYILATHSEEIFRSVDESRRAVLVPNNNGETA